MLGFSAISETAISAVPGGAAPPPPEASTAGTPLGNPIATYGPQPISRARLIALLDDDLVLL